MTRKTPTPEQTRPDKPADLKALSPAEIRKNIGLSQEKMAALLGMSSFGYGQWERGLRSPGGPAFRLLKLIQADADMVQRTLSTTA